MLLGIFSKQNKTLENIHISDSYLELKLGSLCVYVLIKSIKIPIIHIEKKIECCFYILSMFVRINQHFSIQLVLKEMKNKLLGIF